MKQSEVDKALAAAFKPAIEVTAWKKAGGFLYCQKYKLFFRLIILGVGKAGTIQHTLDYKHFEFDDLFWRIVRLPENSKRPLSFRAQGAWVFPSFRVYEGELPNSDWELRHLTRVVEGLVAEADARSAELAERVRTPDQNLDQLERLLSKLMQDYPGAAVDICRERMMTAILNRDIPTAKRIVRDRISGNDIGGFSMGSKSFYHLAAEFLETLPASASEGAGRS